MTSLLDKWLLLRRVIADPELPAAAKPVAYVLLQHFNLETGRCDPSRETIGQEAGGISGRMVTYALSALVSRGYLRRQLRGHHQSSHYSPVFEPATGDTQASNPLLPSEPSLATDCDPESVSLAKIDTQASNPLLPKTVIENGKEERKNAAADAAGAAAPSLEVLVYRHGKTLLGKGSGGQVTKLRQAYRFDESAVLDLLAQAASKADPREWIAGVIRKRGEPPELDELGLPKTPISELGRETDELYRRLGVEY